MSIIYSDKNGYFISHQLFILKLYDAFVNKTENTIHFYEHLFHINNPFIRDKQLLNIHSKNDGVKKLNRKRKLPKIEEDELYEKINTFMTNLKNHHMFSKSISTLNNNICARNAAIKFYKNTSMLKTLYGENLNSTLYKANGYIFPPRCQFYCDDIKNMKILGDTKYDFILLDPPWVNKYIKRKKKIKQDEGYKMMINNDLAQLPINEFLNKNGLVCVWCTNSQNHIDTLKCIIFPTWKIKYVACWYWIKITNCGEYVCNFSPPPGKQPYERLIFGRKINCDSKLKNPEENKIIASVPSSVHSHKPPLTELLIPYLPQMPKSLELFARYLLPDYTSFGLEVLKFQHQFLYENLIIDDCTQDTTI